MSDRKFTPSDNYDSLLKQASALHRIRCCLENEVSYYRKKIKEFEYDNVIRLQAQLESEREMNRILTEELEKYEIR